VPAIRAATAKSQASLARPTARQAREAGTKTFSGLNSAASLRISQVKEKKLVAVSLDLPPRGW